MHGVILQLNVGFSILVTGHHMNTVSPAVWISDGRRHDTYLNATHRPEKLFSVHINLRPGITQQEFKMLHVNHPDLSFLGNKTIL